MRQCLTCGAENPDVARFCLLCGASVATDEAAGIERRIVTVIFVDLVGFTSRAERLDPEDVRAVLTPYHQRVRREIESFGGVVEKFIGDAVMGLFGAPFAHGDDAERAVRAALVIRDCVGELAGGDLQIRVAVNTGEAVVSLGARPALGESMVAGDVVNTAARLQAAAPINGVVVGEETYRETRDAIEYEPAEPVVAKGKEHPVQRVGRGGAADEGGRAAARDLRDRRPGAASWRSCARSGSWRRASGCRTSSRSSGRPGSASRRWPASSRARRRTASARVVRGRSLPYRESGAYGSLATQRDAARGRLRERRGRGGGRRSCGSGPRSCSPAATAIRRSSPSTSARSSGSTSAPRRTDRDALFGSARQFLESAAREQPTILVFEDIHWADADLLDLIETFASRVARPAAPARDARATRVPRHARQLGRTALGYTSLTLGPLGDERLRASWRPAGSATPERADAVSGSPKGNPLFIEQLAAAIDETESGSLPTSMRALVAARLDALPRARACGAARRGRRREGVLVRAPSRRSRSERPISARARGARAPRPDPPRRRARSWRDRSSSRSRTS